MKALSVRQPWAWLIVNGFKPLENRDWRIYQRGKILVHASKVCTRREYEAAVAFAQPLLPAGVAIPRLEDLSRGGICGSVDIIGCVTRSDSPWFVGEYAAVLQNPRPTQFRPMAGRLGFFDVPPQCGIAGMAEFLEPQP
jgi:hypothetical protein